MSSIAKQTAAGEDIGSPAAANQKAEAPRAVVLNDWLVASRKALLTWLHSRKESHKENGVPLRRLRTVVPSVSSCTMSPAPTLSRLIWREQSPAARR
jgi:hypothetical protein